MTRLLGHLKGRVVAIGGTNGGTYERRGYLATIETQVVEGAFNYCAMPVLGIDLLLPSTKRAAKKGLCGAFEFGRRTAQERA